MSSIETKRIRLLNKPEMETGVFDIDRVETAMPSGLGIFLAENWAVCEMSDQFSHKL